jgi:hypothetical protein
MARRMIELRSALGRPKRPKQGPTFQAETGPSTAWLGSSRVGQECAAGHQEQGPEYECLRIEPLNLRLSGLTTPEVRLTLSSQSCSRSRQYTTAPLGMATTTIGPRPQTYEGTAAREGVKDR